MASSAFEPRLSTVAVNSAKSRSVPRYASSLPYLARVRGMVYESPLNLAYPLHSAAVLKRRRRKTHS
jgi:hypothetical protein